MRRPSPLMWVFVILGMAGCAGAAPALTGTADTPVPRPVPSSPESGGEEPSQGQAVDGTPTPLPGNLDGILVVEDDQEYFIARLIERDGIRPVYEPQFVTAAQAGLQPEELVMGVEINGDARAYPVGILRSREMVNDVVGGTPVLVTW